MVLVPGLEQLDDLTAVRIVGLNALDPLDRISAARRKERIPTPGAPVLEAPERPAGIEVLGVLAAAPTPDGQGGEARRASI